MTALSTRDIRRLRLQNQWLSPRPDATAVEVVRHMGALQSQEIWSGHWSIAARSSDLTLDDVHDATTGREILRTWPMRGTIHFVPAVDTHWMLDLTESVAFKGVERRRERLGLSEADALRAVEILRDALGKGEPVTRADCVTILTDAGLISDSGLAYHLLWFASQRGVACIGPQVGTEQTFVSLDTWVTDPVSLSHDEALGELAYRYFDSHGPADAAELRRWTGLPAGQVRKGIENAGDRLTPVETELGSMLVSTPVADRLGRSPVEAPEKSRAVLLLSGFDEYMLGYGDRSTMMTKEQMQLVVPGSNGMFRPTVVDDGVVVGIWKRAVKKSRVDIEVTPFGSLNARQRKGVDRAAGEYGAFIGLDTSVTVVD